MANEHIEELKKARSRLVEERRTFAKQIAGPFERDKTVDARAKITETQTIIDTIDRAIKDEEAIDLGQRQDEAAKRERPGTEENAYGYDDD
jgi:hypothetical protein